MAPMVSLLERVILAHIFPQELNQLISWYSKYKEALTLFDEHHAPALTPIPKPLILPSASSNALFAVPTGVTLIQQPQSSQNDVFSTGRSGVFGGPSVLVLPSEGPSVSSELVLPMAPAYEVSSSASTLADFATTATMAPTPLPTLGRLWMR